MVDGGYQLAQRLRHQPGLEADMRLAHFAIELGAGGQRGHGVDHHDVQRVAFHQRFADVQRFLAGVGLGDEQVVDVDADLLGIARIKRVLGIDEGRRAACLLGVGDHMGDERGFSG